MSHWIKNIGKIDVTFVSLRSGSAHQAILKFYVTCESRSIGIRNPTNDLESTATVWPRTTGSRDVHFVKTRTSDPFSRGASHLTELCSLLLRPCNEASRTVQSGMNHPVSVSSCIYYPPLVSRLICWLVHSPQLCSRGRRLCARSLGGAHRYDISRFLRIRMYKYI